VTRTIWVGAREGLFALGSGTMTGTTTPHGKMCAIVRF
jgi:hypothetical protein